ncbi:MHS family MFS transporter [Microbacteriaceae bacterium VKM Ac-2855]|nr:MHS family MFS transporter [Microbacteriaceae bacterium VKM Ac-2855]
MTHDPSPRASTQENRGDPRRAATAAWIGSALEYYDFFIYGTAAALVFGKLFFAGDDPIIATLLAVATFGVGYLARPIGALVLGHMGDRFGRKRVLVLTVLLMGGSTFVVGCLPTYDTVGPAAAVFLVILRLCQGFSAGGEQAGANSMSFEHAPAGQRAFVTSFTLSGTQAGQILATAIFIPVALLPEDQLLTWGWRLPFWLSAIVVVVAFVIRRTLEETPVFEQQRSEGAVDEAPLKVLLRDHWRTVLRVVAAALIASVSTIFTVYALSFAVNTVGLDRTAMLWVGVLANVVALIAIPLWARLSDRIGRKPVFIVGTVGSAVMMFAYLWSISTGNYPLIFISGIVMFGAVYTATSGAWPATYSEWFPTRVRLSGMALGTQIGFAIAGFAPTIAVAIAGDGPDAWLVVAAFISVLCLINVIAVATAKETFRVPMNELGLAPKRAEIRVDTTVR